MSALDALRIGFGLVSPLSVGVALGVLALGFGLMRRPRAAWISGALGLALLLLASNDIFSDWITARLERRYPAVTAEQQQGADAAIILGGALRVQYPPRPTYQLGASSNRIWHAVELYRAGKVRKLVVAAGARWKREGHPVEADHIVDLLQRWGVPRAAILVDRESGDTRENAQNALALVREAQFKRVLLVTSALHMPRAMLTFERAWAGSGVALLPAPTDHLVTGVPDAKWHLPLPSVGALGQTQHAWREYVGLWTLSWAEWAARRAAGGS